MTVEAATGLVKVTVMGVVAMVSVAPLAGETETTPSAVVAIARLISATASCAGSAAVAEPVESVVTEAAPI